MSSLHGHVSCEITQLTGGTNVINTGESSQPVNALSTPPAPARGQDLEPPSGRESKSAAPVILRDRNDLVVRHFRAQHRRPVALLDVDVSDLLPHQRALLVCDGTITSLIEAFTLEPLTVTLQEESMVPVAAEYAHLLGVHPATAIVRRRVIISGSESYQVYAYAESMLLPDRLPAGFLRTVREDPRGLGSALCRTMVSSRRELLWFGRITSLGWPDYPLPPLPLTSRTYQLVINKNPAMLISEHFAW
jgi:chorismate-pyruvate lyase